MTLLGLTPCPPQQEKSDSRLTTLETNSRKVDLDISEMKTGFTEVKEGMKALKEDLAQLRVVPRGSYYPREVRPLYPAACMPANPFLRPYYNSSASNNRVPGSQITRGITGGPGYVNRPPSPQAPLGIQSRLTRLAQPSAQSPQMGSASPATNPQANQTPMLSSMEGDNGQGEAEGGFSQNANPNLQYGNYDVGQGWNKVDKVGRLKIPCQTR